MSQEARELLELYSETEISVWSTDISTSSQSARWSGQQRFNGLKSAVEAIIEFEEPNIHPQVFIHSPGKDIILTDSQLAVLLSEVGKN